jgi:drug/metabolite transporter (DMT)-like permease
MVITGIAWGIYSLRGRGGTNPAANTASNFIRTLPFAVLLSVVMSSRAALDNLGIGYAVASGGLASGLGYAIWYSVLPGLRATSAAIVQLSVPVIAALVGAIVLNEAIKQQLALSAIAILAVIALVITGRRSNI